MDELKLTLRRMDGSELPARWPTDEELKTRQKGRTIISRELGRGKSEIQVLGGEESDLALLKAITSNEALTDQNEAYLLLRSLLFVQITKVERDGEGLEVTLQCALGELAFTVKRPTAAQVKKADGIQRNINLPNNATEFKVNMALSAEIFDELCDQKETSIIYKHEVTKAVIGEVNRLLDPSERP